jgi:hypothetical protein
MVVRDTAPWWPTFEHGAGYVCDKHAAEAKRGGCVESVGGVGKSEGEP